MTLMGAEVGRKKDEGELVSHQVLEWHKKCLKSMTSLVSKIDKKASNFHENIFRAAQFRSFHFKFICFNASIIS